MYRLGRQTYGSDDDDDDDDGVASDDGDDDFAMDMEPLSDDEGEDID